MASPPQTRDLIPLLAPQPSPNILTENHFDALSDAPLVVADCELPASLIVASCIMPNADQNFPEPSTVEPTSQLPPQSLPLAPQNVPNPFPLDQPTQPQSSSPPQNRNPSAPQPPNSPQPNPISTENLFGVLSDTPLDVAECVMPIANPQVQNRQVIMDSSNDHLVAAINETRVLHPQISSLVSSDPKICHVSPSTAAPSTVGSPVAASESELISDSDLEHLDSQINAEWQTPKSRKQRKGYYDLRRLVNTQLCVPKGARSRTRGRRVSSSHGRELNGAI